MKKCWLSGSLIFFEFIILVLLSLPISNVTYCNGNPSVSDCYTTLESPLYNVYNIGFSIIFFTLSFIFILLILLRFITKKQIFDYFYILPSILQMLTFIYFDIQFSLLLWARILIYIFLSLLFAGTIFEIILRFYERKCYEK